MFESYGKSQKVVRNRAGRMTYRRGVLDQTLRPTKTAGVDEEFGSRSDFDGLVSSSLDANRKHTPEIGHLPRGNVVAGVG